MYIVVGPWLNPLYSLWELQSNSHNSITTTVTMYFAAIHTLVNFSSLKIGILLGASLGKVSLNNSFFPSKVINIAFCGSYTALTFAIHLWDQFFFLPFSDISTPKSCMCLYQTRVRKLILIPGERVGRLADEKRVGTTTSVRFVEMMRYWVVWQ